MVVTGGSGTGKSTLARSLQDRLLPTQWLHFSVDTILYCLPPSILEMANGRNDWSLIDTRSVHRSAYACLAALLDDGNRVIFDCVVMTERGAKELLVALRAYHPVLIELTCSWEETRRRTIARGDRTLEEAERGFETAGRCLEPDYRVDTTQRDADDIARMLIDASRQQPRHQAWEQNLARYAAG